MDEHPLAGIEDVKRKFGQNKDSLCATGTERKNTFGEKSSDFSPNVFGA